MARVWGGIILGFRTDLHVQSVTMLGHIYRDVILEQHVRLFRGAMGAVFMFMDDNARPHRANNVDECLRSEDITLTDWPAYSLDLNTKEHVKHLDIPKWPRDRAVVDFRIDTGYDWVSRHLNMIDFSQSPLYKLCVSYEEMDAIHIAVHSTLNHCGADIERLDTKCGICRL
ncbi:transposable element Tcb1 transposase [Trichonephila clavipes]|nr:transposable element Tcb1 transposase [Trichonephila clavipes]